VGVETNKDRRQGEGGEEEKEEEEDQA